MPCPRTLGTIDGMAEPKKSRLLNTSTIVIGYAMSRLDARYLQAFNHSSWREAFAHASDRLSVAPASFKNLRDEFDPVHGNARRGWHARPLRKSRQRVIGELCETSDDALLELVSRIFAHDREALAEAVKPLARPLRVVHNVADRLLTGRLAEQFFLENSHAISGIERSEIIDRRNDACGFDFGTQRDAGLAIEVKGIKTLRGTILFTDREWSEARLRSIAYWLVVVGNLTRGPVARLIRDPRASLTASCRYQRTVSAQWTATVDVAELRTA